MSKGRDSEEPQQGTVAVQNTQDLIDAELEARLVDHSVVVFESALREAFERHRDRFVHEISAKLGRSALKDGVISDNGSKENEWIAIESLSRLRNLVGGRFQNLKKKWMNAGFPLREHRGDKGTDYQVDQKGWIELSNWILKQGYEAKLAPEQSKYLFELRELDK